MISPVVGLFVEWICMAINLAQEQMESKLEWKEEVATAAQCNIADAARMRWVAQLLLVKEKPSVWSL